jgi:hypothetical protein
MHWLSFVNQVLLLRVSLLDLEVKEKMLEVLPNLLCGHLSTSLALLQMNKKALFAQHKHRG